MNDMVSTVKDGLVVFWPTVYYYFQCSTARHSITAAR